MQRSDILYASDKQAHEGEIRAMPRQHQSSRMKKVLAELNRLGFEVIRKPSGAFKIVPPSTIKGPVYNTHGTESALHPMRRDFKRLYNVELHV